MLTKSDIRTLYESRFDARKSRQGRAAFVLRVGHMLGLTDEYGKRFYDDASNQIYKNKIVVEGKEVERIRPTKFSLAQLGRGILGDDLFENLYQPGREAYCSKQHQAADMFGVLMEAGEAAVGASAFANINAFTGVVAGLLEISIMEGWNAPEFIGDKLATDDNTKMFEGRKVIGVSRIGDQAEERLPGMPTKRAQIGERWILQPRTVENALACEVLQEAVFLDLTGEVLTNANDVGGWLRYRKELRIIDAWIGVTNTYNYKGNGFNTWQVNGTWNNDLPNNELFHYTQVQNAMILFRDMIDPETNTRVQINPNAMLVQREKILEAGAIVSNGMVQFRDAPGSVVNPQQIREYPNPMAGKFELIESALVYERINAANGLNVSAVNAGKYWWLFEKGKALKYAQNWPLRVQPAAPGQLDMIDRGVVMYVKADERGVPMWYEPRRAVRCKP